MFKKARVLISTAVFVLVLGLCAGFAYAEGSKTGTITGEGVNVRASSNTSSNVVTQLSKGTQVTVVDNSNGWYKVSYGKTTGWVYGQYVSLKDTTIGSGIITGNNVNVRSGSSASSSVLTRLNKGSKVDVISRSGDWYKIKISGGTVGWVNNGYISVNGSNVSRGDSDSTTGQKVIDYARKLLGVRYVYGGNSPSQGFDCSGFSKYVYSSVGINLERVASSQATQGVKVDKSDLRSGDLVFFDTNGGHNHINHVGVYIGNGSFIHASSGSSAKKVVISNLSSGFYANAFMTARRVLK